MYHSWVWCRKDSEADTRRPHHNGLARRGFIEIRRLRASNANSFRSSCSTISCLGHSPHRTAIHFSANFLQFFDCLQMKRLFAQRFPHNTWILWNCAGERRFPLIADPNNWRNIRIPNQIDFTTSQNQRDSRKCGFPLVNLNFQFGDINKPN